MEERKEEQAITAIEYLDDVFHHYYGIVDKNTKLEIITQEGLECKYTDKSLRGREGFIFSWDSYRYK